MKLKKRMPLQRLVAKIDNDFNISESDWIPRVAAWVIDALSQMKVLPMEKKKRTLEVVERVAKFPCELNATELKVYDSNGFEIVAAEDSGACDCSKNVKTTEQSQIAVYKDDKEGVNFMQVATINSGCGSKNFVLDNCNNIELNFDTDSITVESYEVATYYDDYYDCEVPYIYDNGLLLEALAWYCVFKYLSRGGHHPVFDLKSPNQMLNPYAQWQYFKPKAASSVKNDIAKNSGSGWNNFFYNATFLPRSN